MKKTLTINLNNIVFNIDDDAFEVLNKYLFDISNHFSSDEDKEDIMLDIEARIAELFNERLNRNKNVITTDDVNEIIGIMGNPSQFSDSENTEEQQSTEGTSENTKSEKKKQRKRFYRDPENSFLGGVAGGLAAYLNIDVTIIRIIFVVLAFISSGIAIPAYILVWLITPEAKTFSQRLEMQGEDVTVENIKSEFNNAKNYVQSDDFKSSVNSVGRTLGNIFKWIVKAFFVFIGIILGFVGFVIIAALIFALFVAIFNPALASDAFFFGIFNTEGSMLLPLIALLLVIGCPIFILIYWAIRTVSGKKDKSRTAYWVTLILWLAGLFMLISIGAKTSMKIRQNGIEPLWNMWNNEEDFQDEIRFVEKFDAIDVSGNISLDILQADTQSVVISTYPSYLSSVTTTVENGTLYIGSNNSNNISRSNPIKIALTTNSLNEITARGACKINTENKFKTDSLNILLQGASNADLNVDVSSKLEIRMEGASKIHLEGVCQTMRIEAYGASKINSENLITKYADVEVAGASFAKVYASESINADALGASKISCIGSPKIVNKKTHIGSSITVK